MRILGVCRFAMKYSISSRNSTGSTMLRIIRSILSMFRQSGTYSSTNTVSVSNTVDSIHRTFSDLTSNPSPFSPIPPRQSTIKNSDIIDPSFTSLITHQSPNCSAAWSISQRPREDALASSRFIQIDLKKQPFTASAMSYVLNDPIELVQGRKTYCDGGGPLGHPKVYINLVCIN